MEKYSVRYKISLVDWILSKPEGKQFLTVLLYIVLSLSSCIIYEEIRHDKDERNLRDCQNDKFTQKEKDDFMLLNFLIKTNERSDYKNKLIDSLNIEIKNIIK